MNGNKTLNILNFSFNDITQNGISQINEFADSDVGDNCGLIYLLLEVYAHNLMIGKWNGYLSKFKIIFSN